MRYFDNREQAGSILAEKLKKYSNENSVIVSLTEGGVVVGVEVAKAIHASVYLLVTEDIVLPGISQPVATLSSGGTYTANNELSTGVLEELNADYRSVIEQQTRIAFQKLNRLSDSESKIPKKLLKNHTVIFVSDGFRSGLSLDVAADFIKPIKTKRLVVVSPFASIEAVDKMHLLADEIECLNVVEEYMDTNHYYKNNKLPDHQTLVKTMENIIINW